MHDPAAAKPKGKEAIRAAFEILYDAGLEISYRSFCFHLNRIKTEEQMKEARAQEAQEKNSESQSVSKCNHCSCHQILAERGYQNFVEALKFFDGSFPDSQR